MTHPERKVYESELTFSLSKIKFQKFRAAVKKYGHVSQLISAHWQAISEGLGVQLAEPMENNASSEEALIFKDGKFCYQERTGSYDPYRVILIGFLYCPFTDKDTHASDLWLLLNH